MHVLLQRQGYHTLVGVNVQHHAAGTECMLLLLLQLPEAVKDLEGAELVEHAGKVQSAVMMAVNEHNTVAHAVSVLGSSWQADERAVGLGQHLSRAVCMWCTHVDCCTQLKQ
jgi:hypothetical protein